MAINMNGESLGALVACLEEERSNQLKAILRQYLYKGTNAPPHWRVLAKRDGFNAAEVEGILGKYLEYARMYEVLPALRVLQGTYSHGLMLQQMAQRLVGNAFLVSIKKALGISHGEFSRLMHGKAELDALQMATVADLYTTLTLAAEDASKAQRLLAG